MQEHGFLEQALIYLAAGVVFVPVFRRLGLGAVLGYLVAGVAIGPWGLRLVAAPEAILHFAEFGVVLLLFLVGLELNPQRLWQMRKSIFGMGLAQMVATGGAVFALALALGQPSVVAVVAGMAFAMSSTAIGLATLEEKGLLATPGGQASFSVLLFQDMAVIPMVIVLGLMTGAQGDATGFQWMTALRAVLAIAAIIVAGRFLMRPLMRWVANTGLREVFVAFSLLLIIGIALLMNALGLSMALGAFLAGVLLADSEYRHELELDIEPFKGLLLGLFFIAVGMSIDLGLFARAPLLVLGLAAGVVLLKVALLYPVAKTFGYCGRADALLFALALSQIGEFAFVLLGSAQQLLPRQSFDVMTAAVAVSMLSTPLLMLVYQRVLAARIDAAAPREADAIEEQQPVIIAGFGRFGQVVARVLQGLGVGTTVVDHDPNQIELVRSFGNKAYYGDARRADLLAAAGAGAAKLLIVAVDDAEAAFEIAQRARERYPALPVIARARSRSDAFEYVALGVPALRETFGSALDAAEAALIQLGWGALAARRVVRRFRRHDEDMLLRQAPHRGEVKKLIALTQQGREDLMQLLRSESRERVQRERA
ncbi:MAG: monovalent cation:proton antiporter-2 (CPA2) family protein [Betaproteobacteria bacterium]|jgi:glutathione-regulated potassium-efflux system ancillary protein KefC|nr:monovalent cation:proton antiporter-2 (CPA2) family protein [Betaproteobacteria bacterium]